MVKKMLVQPGTECLPCKETHAIDVRIYSRNPMTGWQFYDLISGLLAPFKDFYVAASTQPGGMELSEMCGPVATAGEAAHRVFAMIDKESSSKERTGLAIDTTGWEEQK